LSAGLAVTVCVLLISACGSSDDTGSGSKSGGGEKAPKVAMFSALLNSVGQSEKDGIEQAIGKAGGTVRSFDAKFDLATQTSQIQDAITSGKYNVFVIEPVSTTGLNAPVAAAKAAGIPVIAIVSPIGPDLTKVEPQVDGVVSQVVYPSDKVGESVGELAVTGCEGKDPCEVAILAGSLKLPDDRLRVDSAENVMKQHPNIKVVATQDANYDTDEALKVTQNILQAHPDLDVVASIADQMTKGSELAGDKAGKDLGLIGAGGSRTAVEKIKSGDWLGTVAFQSKTLGVKAGEQALNAVQGKPVTPGVDMTREAITKSNVDSYTAEWD
jgi:ribose transport system substrate-binding protein